MLETRRNSNGQVLGPSLFDGKSYDDHQLEPCVDTVHAVVYSLGRYGAGQEISLGDGTWGDMEHYWSKAEVFSCKVRAERAARRFRCQVVVIPWA